MANPASFEDQCEALQRGRGVVELTDWSSITVTGADRQKFLHSFCTNDVNALTPGKYCEAFVTNAKGKIIGHGLISCWDNEEVFIGTPHQAPRLIEHLDRYIIREDVQLRDTSSERTYMYASTLLPALSARWIRFSEIHELGGLLEVASHDVPKVRRIFYGHKFVPCGMAAFESMRIEAGIPLFGVDFDETNFPQEVGRDREAISFTKGCYLGQETVARIDALGHVNQKLVGVRFSGADVPTVEAALARNGAQVGRVTSAAYSPQLGAPLALAMVRREANTPGTPLESPVGDCEVISLPLKPADA